MKRLYTLFAATLFSFALFAQPSGNQIVYDCSGNSKNIYSILGTGKSVIVLHKGVDCSICRSSAAGWQTFAAANTTTVEVLGAITYTYNPNNFSNMCLVTQRWDSTYNWNNIFSFPDSNRVWYRFGSPRYYVYTPVDSSIIYQGSSAATARSTALAQATVGLETIRLNESSVNYYDGVLSIENINSTASNIIIYNLSGQLMLEENIGHLERKNFDVSTYSKGLYVVQLRGKEGGISNRKVLIF